MKRLAILALLLGFTVPVAWSFDRVQSGVITSSGTTVVILPFRTSELFFQRTSTGTAYINVTSTSAGTSDRLLRAGVILSDTVDSNSTRFSVFTSELPFNFIYEARGWRQNQP